MQHALAGECRYVFDRLITGDKKWVLYDIPKCKRQRLSPNEPDLKGTFVFGGVLLKPGQTVVRDVYCEQLERVNQSLIEKCPAIGKMKFWNTVMEHRVAKLTSGGDGSGDGRYCLLHHTGSKVRMVSKM